jgi:hypothetical protein
VCGSILAVQAAAVMQQQADFEQPPHDALLKLCRLCGRLLAYAYWAYREVFVRLWLVVAAF